MTSNGTHGKKTLLITKASNTSGHTTQWCAHAMVLTHGKSPRVIPRAVTPSALKGCVGTLKNGYVHNVPLSRAPRIQSASHVTNQSQVDAYKYASNSHVTYQPHSNTCYSQESRVPTWCDLVRSLAGLGSNILPFSPVQLMQ
jgi:hypothetical protein